MLSLSITNPDSTNSPHSNFTDIMRSIRHLLMLLLLACCTASCSNHKQKEALDRAEYLMEAHPDSALIILNEIEKPELGSKKEQARYALLMSMALDKNYIDTTAFDVLQPAIDYYLKKGTPDEKLRTYYYQGRIFQNQGDKDNALISFVKGLDNISNCKDSLCLARTLVSQAGLYYEFYDIDSYMQNHLHAANIYNNLSMKNHEFDCLVNALNGAILLKQPNISDSLINICNGLDSLTDIQNRKLQGRILAYTTQHGTKEDVKTLIEQQEKTLSFDISSILNLASAHNKIGNNEKALEILKFVDKCGLSYDTLKYQSISVSAFRDLGDYKNAFSMYWDFSHRLDSINSFKFDQKAQSINERHKIELKAQIETRKKSKIIWGCIGGIVFFAMIAFILYLLTRSNKAKKNLALQKAKTTELENERLKSEKNLAHQKAKAAQLENDKLKTEREKLSLENKNLQLERDKKALEAENLAHRVETLENESASLKELIDSQEELPSEVQQAIKVRIEMLNALMAGYITDNDQYEKPYESWIKELTDNTEEFMNSNRLAFQASHPRFIQYFEEHDLTVSEINYVCLYAIGLRGKEVGNYMKKRSHVNISSGIRKKLGIDKHETNIGIYVRKLLKEL